MKRSTVPVLVLLGALGASSFAPAQNAHAVVLKQKWQAGQKLNYALDLSGTMNLQPPPDSPIPNFGAPIEAQVKGQGVAALDTLKVSPDGVGTIAVTVPKWTMDAQVLIFKAQWSLLDGKSQLTVNGKEIETGAPQNIGNKADVALQLGADGALKGFEPVGKAPVVAPKKAFENAVAVAALVRALPALWPSRDVKNGETWQANINVAGLERPAQNGEAAKPLGAFDMKLEGEEVVGGQTWQRVAVKGDIDLDGKTLENVFPPAAVAKATPTTLETGAAKPQPRLDHFTQTVDGHLWFDAKRGQIARAALILGGRAQATTPKPNGTPGAPAWVDFTGTLNMNLQDTGF